jgi:EgtB-related family protein
VFDNFYGTSQKWVEQTLAEGFDWGEVWEWTDSPFTPYPDFVAHPYRDYSAPWFGTRQVLRGASFATHARMRHVRYRNFYTPARNDIFAGFRSCAR